MKQLVPRARSQRTAGFGPPPPEFADSGLAAGGRPQWRNADVAANDVPACERRDPIASLVQARTRWSHRETAGHDAALVDELGLELLDCANVAAFAIRADARIVFATTRTEGLVSGASSVFVVSQGRLTLRCATQQRCFAELVENALLARHGGAQRMPSATTFARPGRLPLTVAVTAARGTRRPDGQEPLALVIVRDPDQMHIDLEVLKSCFGFTGTEAAVARYLAAGESVEAIAGLQAVSVATVRTQVNKLLLKTQTRRQGELISVILRSVR